MTITLIDTLGILPDISAVQEFTIEYLCPVDPEIYEVIQDMDDTALTYDIAESNDVTYYL